MNIAIVSGSPRKGMNSEKMAELAKDSCKGHDVRIFRLSEKKVGPCTDCGYCKSVKGCSQDDDMDYGLLEWCDSLLCITPTYLGGMTAQMKAFIDRTVPLRRNGFLLKRKRGAAMAVGGSRNGGQEHAVNQIHQAMLIHGMVVVGDASHFGGIVHAPLEEDREGAKTVRNTALELIG